MARSAGGLDHEQVESPRLLPGMSTDCPPSKPGVFFAGYASSAVVQSITDYWGYFDVIRQVMPQNCSADVQAVVSYIDTTFTNGSQAQINSIKSNFGLGDMTHLDDVAGACK